MDQDSQWDVWEVFVQEKAGDAHVHAGSVHAADSETALQNARDVYSRRGSVSSMWVVPLQHLVATSSEEGELFFDPENDKAYRHPKYYQSPRGIKNL